MTASLKKLVGIQFVPFDARFPGGPVRGFASRSGFASDAAVRRVLARRAAALDADFRLFAGYPAWVLPPPTRGQVRLYAVRGLTAPQIAGLAGIGVGESQGSRAAWQAILDEDPDGYIAKRVRSGVFTLDHLAPDVKSLRPRMRKFFESVHRRCPYEIIVAFPKSFRAAFVRPPSGVDAGWIERKVHEMDPLPEEVDGRTGAIAKAILRTGELTLWWDT